MNFRSHINNPDKGFTLIEIMVVVAIISILASIAIPIYASFRYKTKTAEAKAMFNSVKAGQETYLSENEVYLVCLSSPGGPGTAGPIKRPWIDNGGFTIIGYEPAGDVHFNYSVAIGPNAAGTAAREMAIEAEGNLDGDAAPSYYTISSNGIVAGASSGIAPATPWDIFHSGDDF